MVFENGTIWSELTSILKHISFVKNPASYILLQLQSIWKYLNSSDVLLWEFQEYLAMLANHAKGSLQNKAQKFGLDIYVQTIGR